MAEVKVTALAEATSISTDDLIMIIDDPAGSEANKKITFDNVLDGVKAETDIADAIAKKHTQNTDTILDEGGANEQSAALIKSVTDRFNASAELTTAGIEDDAVTSDKIAADSISPEKMDAQIKTVTHAASPAPDYVGQPGQSSDGELWVAVALAGNPQWTRVNPKGHLIATGTVTIDYAGNKLSCTGNMRFYAYPGRTFILEGGSGIGSAKVTDFAYFGTGSDNFIYFDGLQTPGDYTVELKVGQRSAMPAVAAGYERFILGMSGGLSGGIYPLTWGDIVSRDNDRRLALAATEADLTLSELEVTYLQNSAIPVTFSNACTFFTPSVTNYSSTVINPVASYPSRRDFYPYIKSPLSQGVFRCNDNLASGLYPGTSPRNELFYNSGTITDIATVTESNRILVAYIIQGGATHKIYFRTSAGTQYLTPTVEYLADNWYLVWGIGDTSGNSVTSLGANYLRDQGKDVFITGMVYGKPSELQKVRSYFFDALQTYKREIISSLFPQNYNPFAYNLGHLYEKIISLKGLCYPIHDPLRILIVGDSNIRGWGIARFWDIFVSKYGFDDTSTDVTNDGYGTSPVTSVTRRYNKDMEMIYAPVNGYRFDDLNNLFPGDAIYWKPDLVIASSFSNDFRSRTSFDEEYNYQIYEKNLEYFVSMVRKYTQADIILMNYPIVGSGQYNYTNLFERVVTYSTVDYDVTAQNAMKLVAAKYNCHFIDVTQLYKNYLRMTVPAEDIYTYNDREYVQLPNAEPNINTHFESDGYDLYASFLENNLPKIIGESETVYTATGGGLINPTDEFNIGQLKNTGKQKTKYFSEFVDHPEITEFSVPAAHHWVRKTVGVTTDFENPDYISTAGGDADDIITLRFKGSKVEVCHIALASGGSNATVTIDGSAPSTLVTGRISRPITMRTGEDSKNGIWWIKPVSITADNSYVIVFSSATAFDLYDSGDLLTSLANGTTAADLTCALGDGNTFVIQKNKWHGTQITGQQIIFNVKKSYSDIIDCDGSVSDITVNTLICEDIEDTEHTLVITPNATGTVRLCYIQISGNNPEFI